MLLYDAATILSGLEELLHILWPAESLWQVCGGAWVNSLVGTNVLSNSAGMTAQVSPGTCSVRLDPLVHLESLLSLLPPDPPEGLPLTFDVLCVCQESHL